MLTYRYAWRIPPEERENFERDWIELTKVAQSRFGVISANLYFLECGEYLAIAQWPTLSAWERWVKELATHPMREKYRQWRVAGPEPIVSVFALQKP